MKEARKEDRPATKSDVQLDTGLNVGFIEVVNENEVKATDEIQQQEQIVELQKKANFSDNQESNAAIQAAISFLQNNKQSNVTDPSKAQVEVPTAEENKLQTDEKTADKKEKPKENEWGIYTFFYDDGHCDYEAS